MSRELRRRSTRDYLLPFLIIIALGIFAALCVRLWGLLYGDTATDSGSFSMNGEATLTAISGNVEAYLPASQAWKIIRESTILNPQEGARTGADGMARLTLNDGSLVTLGNSSEIRIDDLENSLSQKTVALTLLNGSAWIEVGATQSQDFSISSELMRLDNPAAKVLFLVGVSETSASAVGGDFTATILDPKNTGKKSLKTYMVSPGETIAVSDKKINLMRIGGEIKLVKETTTEVTASPLYLAMRTSDGVPTKTEGIKATGTTDETGATTIAGDTLPTDISEKGLSNPATPTPTTETTTPPLTSSKSLTAPVVITGGGSIQALASPVLVSGSVSADIVKVEVTHGGNPAFALSKFVAGSGSWKYNASATIGNLKEGKNTYTVVGYDKAGNKTPTTKFTIDYTPTQSAPATPATPALTTPTTSPTTSGSIPAVGSATFAAPTVLQPTDGATLTTAPIIFSGSVPAGTSQVLVNGYALTKFVAGSTTWFYQADPKYGNLKEGENVYEIEAVSETGERSSVAVKLIYQPAAAPATTPAL